MAVNWVMVSTKVLLFLSLIYVGWAVYPFGIQALNSYIDYRIDEHLISSININHPPPPIKELDGYQLDRQPEP